MGTTWRKLINKAFEENQDSWENVEGCTLSEKELDQGFDNSFGKINGKRFSLWTKEFTYFPVIYEGGVVLGYTPRNPCEMKTPHQGGW